MTQEDKELLLKDLCARVPYGVKYVRYSWNYDTDQELPVIETLECADKDGYINHIRVYTVDDIKPYLFPLSSMNEEQKRELRQMDAFVSTFGQICFSTYDDYGHELMPTFEDAIRIEKWLNKNHFDYRGLIEKSLALDATGLNIY